MKIALGTAQFGLPYGIANTGGQIIETVGRQILDVAIDAGINTIDTAIAYGDSEKCLGNLGVSGWSIVTKLPEVPADQFQTKEWIEKQFFSSLHRLKVDRISGFLLHRPAQLLKPNGKDIWGTLQNLKSKGQIDKIGYSIYSPEELNLLAEEFLPDIIQAPANVIDQRLKSSGWLQYLADHNVEVHIRSVFLQGLLLMSYERIPERFRQWYSILNAWNQWLAENELNALEGCLWPMMSEDMFDYLVIGVDSLLQLEQILEVVQNFRKLPMPDFDCPNECELINPAKW